MRNEIEVEFEELPTLFGSDGVGADYATGVASVVFDDSGDWHVTGIALTGHRKATAAEVARTGIYVRQNVELCPKAWPERYAAIRQQLEHGGYAATIDGKVAEALDEMGVVAPALERV